MSFGFGSQQLQAKAYHRWAYGIYLLEHRQEIHDSLPTAWRRVGDVQWCPGAASSGLLITSSKGISQEHALAFGCACDGKLWELTHVSRAQALMPWRVADRLTKMSLWPARANIYNMGAAERMAHPQRGA
eukprot:s2704_g3.t1